MQRNSAYITINVKKRPFENLAHWDNFMFVMSLPYARFPAVLMQGKVKAEFEEVRQR